VFGGIDTPLVFFTCVSAVLPALSACCTLVDVAAVEAWVQTPITRPVPAYFRASCSLLLMSSSPRAIVPVAMTNGTMRMSDARPIEQPGRNPEPVISNGL
jgi:hypothetical protein